MLRAPSLRKSRASYLCDGGLRNVSSAACCRLGARLHRVQAHQALGPDDAMAVTATLCGGQFCGGPMRSERASHGPLHDGPIGSPLILWLSRLRLRFVPVARFFKRLPV